MKKSLFAVMVIIFMACFVYPPLGNAKSNTLKTGAILSVNDIQADRSAFKGTITITGVVAAVFKEDPKLFAIIETKEAKLCKSTGCAKFYLPVQYEREIPKLWDEVNVTGSFEGGDPNFRATNVDVLRHLTFGDKQ